MLSSDTINKLSSGESLLETSERKPGNERQILYEKGLKFKRNSSFENALKCFLCCLQDLEEDDAFPELPSCLHNVAEMYSQLGQFEKAIPFVQAEKLFYETALIQAGKQESNELKDKERDLVSLDPNASSHDALTANEYEKLSQMCLHEKNIQLALEYAGKATQLRKRMYGESHLITIQSLNQFTLIYAKMGREQYTAAMKRFSQPTGDDYIANNEHVEDHEVLHEESAKDSEEQFQVSADEKGKSQDETRNDVFSSEDEGTGKSESDDVIHKSLKTDKKSTGASGQVLFLCFVFSVLFSLLFSVYVGYKYEINIFDMETH